MRTLEIDSLSKSFNTVRALQSLSFNVHAGEIFGFVGSNGAGKTTAMRIMLGVLAADSGEVRFDDKVLDLAMRRRIGYMPEERGLYPKMKVGEQLRYLARLHGMTKAEAAESTDKWTERLNVHTRRDDAVEDLSLGNQQRVQLAAALVYNPEILVLDEPFSGLDPVAVDIMSSVLRERADAGVPVIFSSHQLDLVQRLCDRVGIISKGSMIAKGTIDELRTTDRPVWQVTISAPNVSTESLRSVVPGSDIDSAVKATSITATITLPAGRPNAEQELLAEALRLGPVTEFATIRPNLADLYRGVVTDAPEGDDESGDEQTTGSDSGQPEGALA